MDDKLSNFVERLNSDESFRDAFIADPSGCLKGEGVALDDERAKRLKEAAQKIKESGGQAAAAYKPGTFVVSKASK